MRIDVITLVTMLIFLGASACAQNSSGEPDPASVESMDSTVNPESDRKLNSEQWLLNTSPSASWIFKDGGFECDGYVVVDNDIASCVPLKAVMALSDDESRTPEFNRDLDAMMQRRFGRWLEENGSLVCDGYLTRRSSEDFCEEQIPAEWQAYEFNGKTYYVQQLAAVE